MQKIKNMLHHNTDANHNGIPDSQERTGATTTTGRDPILHDHGTNIHNPAVAPMTGSTAPVVVGQHGVVGGLNDRNHNGIPDSQERGATGGPIQKVKDALHLNKDANHNGIPDSQERDRNHNGIPDSQERGAHHNPLDRNHDGKVNLQDLKSNKDRNHNGIPDNQERSGLVGGLNDRKTEFPTTKKDLDLDNKDSPEDLTIETCHNGIPDNQERLGLGQQGLAGGFNDRNMNGIPDNQERLGQGLLPGQGVMGQRTANPLDRNNDGRVDLKDLTGQPGYSQQGLAGQQGGLMGQRTANPLDRNNDGKVDLRDLAANKVAPAGSQAPLRTL
eukprot:TRINITY_DN76_c0_g1_i2.p1 TRINITY_DN76_c0_g1~~TRINITY_DN76_c0_g1_i2.p1  ORF type:complete len:330 (-),score=116.80 TRINITY_DN76_c0_g1_i2:64-1053(-)